MFWIIAARAVGCARARHRQTAIRAGGRACRVQDDAVGSAVGIYAEEVKAAQTNERIGYIEGRPRRTRDGIASALNGNRATVGRIEAGASGRVDVETIAGEIDDAAVVIVEIDGGVGAGVQHFAGVGEVDYAGVDTVISHLNTVAAVVASQGPGDGRCTGIVVIKVD